MRILFLSVLFFAFLSDISAQTCSGAFESVLDMYDTFNLRDWIRQWYTRKVRNILTPLARKVRLEIDSQMFALVVDTGSDITWVPMQNVTVLSPHKDLHYESYYTPMAGQRGPRFTETYGSSGTTGHIKGFKYFGPVKFLSSRCKVNLTYAVADHIEWTSRDFAGIFGASMKLRENSDSIIDNPQVREVIPAAVFTIALKPWSGLEHFERRQSNMGSIEIGGLDKHHCHSFVYAQPSRSVYWEFPIGLMRFGFTFNVSQYRNPDMYIRGIYISDLRTVPVIDSGSPMIGIPENTFLRLRLGGLNQRDVVKFGCNDTEFWAELRVTMAGDPNGQVIMDKRHLMKPVVEGRYDLCMLKIFPTRGLFILGLPFYAAAGCVTHDFDERRVGIAPLRRDLATGLWAAGGPNSYDLQY